MYEVRLFVTGKTSPTDIVIVPTKKLSAKPNAIAADTEIKQAAQATQAALTTEISHLVSTVASGRPDFAHVLAQLQAETQEAGERFMGVMTCGPESLMRDVYGAVSACNKHDGVIVHLHQETFEL